MADPTDDRSSLVIAYSWASRIVGVSIEMVAPGLIGLWLDEKLATRCLFLLIGFAAGMSFGLWHLIRMTSPPSTTNKEEQGTGERKHR